MTSFPQTAAPARPAAGRAAGRWRGLRTARVVPQAALPARAALASLVLLLLAPACDRPAAESPDAVPAADDEPAAPTLDANRHARDYPALAARANGETWLACVLWEDGADRIELRGVGLAEPVRREVYRSPTRILGTAAAVDDADALHVVWSEQVADGWDLRELVLAAPAQAGEPGDAGAPVTLRHVAGSHQLWPVLAADGDRALLLACVELNGGGSTIVALARPAGGAWGVAADVAPARGSCWSPAVTSTGAGRFAVAWDGAAGGDYDVLLAPVDLLPGGGLRVGGCRRVTDTPRREVHPSLAWDGQRLAVAYDVGPERWGREGSVNKLDQSLHGGRHVEVVCVTGGSVAPLAVQPLSEMNDLLARNCELPEIAFESTGNLVMLFRGLPLPLEYDDPEDPAFQERAAAKAGGLGWRTAIWFTYMTRFDGHAWRLADKHHVGVPGSEGRADAPLTVLVRPSGGVAYAVVGDGREVDAPVQEGPVSKEELRNRLEDSTNWWKPVSTRATAITTGMIRKGDAAAEFALGPARALSAPRAPGVADAVPLAGMPERTLPDGRRLLLALGDLHRHTDVSRCSPNWDGPFEDALRYAFDVAPLQFVAVTDHFEHMTAWDWRRNLAWADAYDAPGRLVSLRAYERSEPRTGHRNVIARGAGPPLVGYRGFFAADRDAGRADTAPELWPQLDAADVLTIPHTPAGMFPTNPSVFEWATLDPRFDRLVEVFQSYRGSSEAADAPRAIPGLIRARYVQPNLDAGMHFGLVASSDHQTSDGAFAGAWVSALTRDGVFSALHDRLTFASTVRAALWAEWNGVPMGTCARAPEGVSTGFTVEVDGFGRDVATLELVVDGAVTQTRRPVAGVARETFPLALPAIGSRYAYVRVTFTDGELMWSSPVRLGKDGADAPDGLSGQRVLEQRGDVWGPRVTPAVPAPADRAPADRAPTDGASTDRTPAGGPR